MPAKKRPRNVYLGALDYCQTPYQKKKLLKSLSGEVNVIKMYEKIENVLSFEEIQAMTKEKARDYLIKIKAAHSVNTITEHWDRLSSKESFYNSKVYKIFKEYGVPVDTRRMANAHLVRSKMAANGELTYNKQNADAEQLDFKIFDDRSEVAKEPERKPTAKITDFCDLLPPIKGTLHPVPPPKKRSSFTINLDGEFDGVEIADKLKAIAGFVQNGKQYNIILQIEEAE